MNSNHPKPLAYSYIRFSTPDQMQGDSERRQLALAQAYCKKKGLELDDRLTLRDLVGRAVNSVTHS